jgi:hypothetical protein
MIEKYRQKVREDDRRAYRPLNQIVRILLGSLTRTGKYKTIEELVEGRKIEELEVKVDLFDYEKRIGAYCFRLRKRKGQGRAFNITDIYPASQKQRGNVISV